MFYCIHVLNIIKYYLPLSDLHLIALFGKTGKSKSQCKAVVQRGKDRLCTSGCQALKTLDRALREQAEKKGLNQNKDTLLSFSQTANPACKRPQTCIHAKLVLVHSLL